eukprot:5762727-Amphidinium_carterae.1
MAKGSLIKVDCTSTTPQSSLLLPSRSFSSFLCLPFSMSSSLLVVSKDMRWPLVMLIRLDCSKNTPLQES